MRYLIKCFETVLTTMWAVRTLLNAAPFETIFLSFFVVFQGLIPATSLYAIRSLIDWVSSSALFPVTFVILWAIMLFADIALSPVISVIRLRLNEKILSHCNLLLMEKANTIKSLIPFENSKIYDEIQFLKNEASRRPLNFVYILTGFMKDAVALFSVLLLLGSLEWWIPIGILISSLPHAIATLWFEKQSWDQMLFRSPESRKSAWISSLILNDRVAKEIRLFGFGSFLIERYQDLMKQMHQKISQGRWKQSILFVSLSTITVAGNIGIITFILLGAKEGIYQLGSLVIAIQALVMTQLQLIGCASNLGMCAPCLLFFSKLKFFLTSNICPFSKQYSTMPTLPFQEIHFNNVSFSYPDGRKAISNVSFIMKQGEKLAIVGENGAGKSTLVKLLLRFYDPTEGTISIDGKDLKTLDLEAWRSSISAVFQDFGQYHFTISENIALADLEASKERISHAVQKGGFYPILERLPNGLNTELGKEFDGTTLSGGEWQRLAMSRAFLRESNLLILDEPTSSLDPQSEQEIFKKFSDHLDGKTALLITHRLGSVKMANRILVFKNGKLIEDGTHTNLMGIQGEYCYLYSLQANQYQVQEKLTQDVTQILRT